MSDLTGTPASVPGGEYADESELDDRDREEMDRFERQANDIELFNEARNCGVGSRQHRMLEMVLARYAMSVLEAWVRSGEIFKQVARLKMGLRPTYEEMYRLADDPHHVADLVNDTVLRALKRLSRQLDNGDGWNPDGGASVSTFFIGSCVLDFRDEFLKARRARMRENALDDRLQQACVNDHLVADRSSAETAVEAGDVYSRVAELPTREQIVVRLRMDGYDTKEIAEILGLPSPGAVRAVLQRFRKKAPTISRLLGLEEE